MANVSRRLTNTSECGSGKPSGAVLLANPTTGATKAMPCHLFRCTKSGDFGEIK
jgi:hypothetical protein